MESPSSVLASLSGRPDGPPLAPMPGVVRGLERLTASVNRWSAVVGSALDVRWEPVVTGRAAVLGFARAGQVSPGGSCRLFAAADGWVAVNLARDDDVAAVDAIVEGDGGGEPWRALAAAAATTSAEAFVARVQLLGVPAASLDDPRVPGVGCTQHRMWQAVAPRRLETLRVVDLSSMWAGPLVAKILSDAGAEVTKVESSTRPDGARSEPTFYRVLHPEGQPEVRVDFGTDPGREELRELLDDADVVIESSRARALEQLGVGPVDVAPRDGRVWISISGYGREGSRRDWVAFGDDAAVAGGLVAWERSDLPAFCGDAIGDPVTGLTAAAAALEAVATGGGVLLDLSMAGCCRALLA